MNTVASMHVISAERPSKYAVSNLWLNLGAAAVLIGFVGQGFRDHNDPLVYLLIAAFFAALVGGAYFWRAGIYVSPTGVRWRAVDGRSAEYGWDQAARFVTRAEPNRLGVKGWGVFLILETGEEVRLEDARAWHLQRRPIERLCEELNAAAGRSRPRRPTLGGADPLPS
jgi:hypothetical protein